MEEIIRFVSLAKTNRFTLTALCERFGISRKTGYKYLARFESEGFKGLRLRSHRTLSCAHQTAEKIEQMAKAERALHQTWGPKRLREVLRTKRGLKTPPATSTIGEILRRNGLSVPRRRKPGIYYALNKDLTIPTQPNHVWTVDFKGWFTLGNGQRCDPLTVCDRFSHYIICCHAQPNQRFKATLATFKAMMR